MAKNLISGDTTTINENGNDISVELNQEYVDFIDKDESLQTTAQTLTGAINELIPVVLYNNSSGSNATITLNDNVSNYKMIDIFYGWQGGGFGLNSVRLYDANNKIANLGQIVMANNNIYVANSTFKPNGTSLTYVSGEYWRWASGGTATRTQTAMMYVYQVVGYK